MGRVHKALSSFSDEKIVIHSRSPTKSPEGSPTQPGWQRLKEMITCNSIITVVLEPTLVLSGIFVHIDPLGFPPQGFVQHQNKNQVRSNSSEDGDGGILTQVEFLKMMGLFKVRSR